MISDNTSSKVTKMKLQLRLITDLLRKVGDHSRGRPEGSLFNSYNTKVLGRALLHSQDCCTLPVTL